MQNPFADILKGKTVIVGIGNSLRGDDGLGPELILKLQGKLKAVCIDAGNSPESYTGKIVKENPDTILLVDAVHLNLPPGQYRILLPEEILKSGFTTHDISPRMFIEYLKTQTQANIYMLGVQPENVSLEEKMSGSIKRTLEEVAKLIKEASPDNCEKI